MADQMSKGRELTDAYKQELRTLVQGWLKKDKDGAAVVAAMGEVTAEAATTVMGPQVAVELMEELSKSIRRRKTPN